MKYNWSVLRNCTADFSCTVRPVYKNPAVPIGGAEDRYAMNTPPSDARTYLVDMEPVGRRTEVEPGATLLEAAQAAGVGLMSLCGGEGWCESCLIRLVSGALTPPTVAEEDALGEELIEQGYRLACQARPLSNVKIDIPPESLTTPQRLQIEGQDVPVKLDPLIRVVDVSLTLPTLYDLRPDATRLEDALADKGHAPVHLSLSVLADLSDRLRAYGWSARVALRQDKVVAILPPESRCLGLAVDIGTTKLAAYLLDMETGDVLAKMGAMNPQIAYGEDVISRIAYTDQHDGGRQLLQERLVEALNEMITAMCAEISLLPGQIVQAVVVGNTAMHHLFAGLPVRQLALSPYVAAVGKALAFRAHEIGLGIAPGAHIQLLPNIAGYVGADHVAVILSTGIWQTTRTVIAVDIGTNTEITLAVGGRLLSCSCASGPAFEGAHIRDGMRAAPGAIERLQIVDGEVRIFTIGNEPPVGICGSGILDAVAEMRATGILDDKGALQASHPHVRIGDRKQPEFVLVPSNQAGHGRDIILSRQDVNEIQLAKGAIRAGIEILMAEAGITANDIEEFIVAGAFGTYISIPNAIRVGMFPELPVERFRQVGNAAGMGARLALLSAGQLKTAADIAERVEYIELTTHAAFQKVFLKAMFL